MNGKVLTRNILVSNVPAMMLATISGRIVNISILINTSPGSPAIQNFVIEYVSYIIMYLLGLFEETTLMDFNDVIIWRCENVSV